METHTVVKLDEKVKDYLWEKGVHPDRLEWNHPDFASLDADEDDADFACWREMRHEFGEAMVLSVPLRDRELEIAEELMQKDLTFLAIVASYGCELKIEEVDEGTFTKRPSDMMNRFTYFLLLYETNSVGVTACTGKVDGHPPD